MSSSSAPASPVWLRRFGFERRGTSRSSSSRSDGPGGRVRTDMVDGFRLDRGFQILLTAYPTAQTMLDYDALDLCAFDAGAMVRIDNSFHRIGDPFRAPGDAWATVRAPIGTLKDKTTVLKFRKAVTKLDIDDLFNQKDTTALARLQELGFSSKMIDRFLRPLFSGIALDPELQFTSRSLDFIFRMLSEGDAAVRQGHGRDQRSARCSAARRHDPFRRRRDRDRRPPRDRRRQ